MTMIRTIPADTIVHLDVSPLAGGHGRNAIAHIPEGASLEGHNSVYDEPAADDDGWFAVAEGETGVVEIDDLPQWIRATGGEVKLEGVQ